MNRLYFLSNKGSTFDKKRGVDLLNMSKFYERIISALKKDRNLNNAEELQVQVLADYERRLAPAY